jgi:hypothetical protein
LVLLNRSFHIGANRARRYRAEGKLLTVQAPISLARDLRTPKQKSAVSLAKDFADYPARTGATKRVSLKSGRVSRRAKMQ